MARIGLRASMQAEITLALTEEEAGALDALAGYGADQFLKVFYEHMGKAYLQPYEKGLRSLFTSVHGGSASVQFFLERAKNARAVIDGRREIGPEIR